MKQIIQDIYKTVSNPPEISDEWVDDLASNIANVIKTNLKPRSVDYKPRMSALGRGDRYIWYSTRPTPKEQLRPEVLIKFLFGHLIEEMLLSLVKLSGYTVSHEQEELELNGIKGHIDCLIDGKLIDVKSASSFSFKKFKSGELHLQDAFGYYAQLAAYAQAGNYDAAGWLVMDKQLGHLCFANAIPFCLPDMDKRTKEVNEVVASFEEPDYCNEPVEDGKSGNMKLAVGCSYCDFKIHCYRNSNHGNGLRKFAYSNGVRYLTTVVKEPNVVELPIGELNET